MFGLFRVLSRLGSGNMGDRRTDDRRMDDRAENRMTENRMIENTMGVLLWDSACRFSTSVTHLFVFLSLRVTKETTFEPQRPFHCPVIGHVAFPIKLI